MVTPARTITYEFSPLKKYTIVHVLTCISKILIRTFVLVKNVHGW